MTGWLASHGAHLAVVVVPVLAMAALVLPEVLRARASSPSASRGFPPARAGIVLSLVGAAALHLAVVPDHLRESVLEGLAMVAFGLAQAALALAVLRRRPSVGLLQATGGTSLVIAALWAASRTTGLPWVPLSTGPDHVVLGVLCSALEIGTLGLTAHLLRRERDGERDVALDVALDVADDGGLRDAVPVGGPGGPVSVPAPRRRAPAAAPAPRAG